MKDKFTSGVLRLMVLVTILTVTAEVAEAQLPDCTSGLIVYAVFNRDVASADLGDSTEIRPVNVNTGAVGALMGGHRYYMRKRRTPTSSTYYYGTSGLGLDLITQRFYAITQMASNLGIGKDIYTINTVTGTQVQIGSTPATVNDHHFVKLGISNNGYGYALGVARDTNLAAATYNPLIRFTTCGAVPSASCSTVELLGYLPNNALTYKSRLFNGDIVFDIWNNMYFVTVASDPVGSNMKYTHARLFRINAADIPSSAGTGVINMSFVADYNTLDTTVVNGIALDGTGNMLIASRIFDNTNTNPVGPYDPVLFKSTTPGNATQLMAFSSPTVSPAYNVADLASCFYPAMILGHNNLALQYKYENGNVNLKWEAKTNPEIIRFEVQRSNSGLDDDFETIGSVTPQGEYFTYSDPQSGYEKIKFYRIKQVMTNGTRYYSNVINVKFNNRFNVIGNLGPNPFNTFVDAKLWLRISNTVNVRILDQGGRTVYTRQFSGKTGDNKFTLDNLGNFKPGVYIVEIAVQEETVREKIIKQQ